MGYKLKLLSCLIINLLVSSCTKSIGSAELPVDRYAYNQTLQYSTMQQQLLNIVRLRYSDPPYFLAVNSIVSQFELTRQGTGTLTGPWVAGYTGAQTQLTFADRPTVTFTPLQGTEFVTKFMRPIDLQVIYMLLKGGWGVRHVLTPLVEEFGPYDYMNIASRVVSSRRPVLHIFEDTNLILNRLQKLNCLKIHASGKGMKYKLKFEIKNLSCLSPKDLVLAKKVLHISKDTPYFYLSQYHSKDPHIIYIRARTVLSLLNYFSKGVDIPEHDIKYHLAPITYLPNGQIFDWRKPLENLFKVRVTSKFPKEALVSIQYRGNWYYILDSDIETKESLMLITIIMGIYEGKIDGFLPVFTVN
jgi:hypothetical protein